MNHDYGQFRALVPNINAFTLITTAESKQFT